MSAKIKNVSEKIISEQWASFEKRFKGHFYDQHGIKRSVETHVAFERAARRGFFNPKNSGLLDEMLTGKKSNANKVSGQADISKSKA